MTVKWPEYTNNLKLLVIVRKHARTRKHTHTYTHTHKYAYIDVIKIPRDVKANVLVCGY